MTKIVKGSQVIEAIDYLVEMQLLDARREFVNHIELIAGHELRDLGINPADSKLRNAVRKLKTEAVTQFEVDALKEILPVLTNAPDEKIMYLCSKLIAGDALQKERDTHSLRTNASFIKGILRPLQLQSSWAEKQNALRSRPISEQSKKVLEMLRAIEITDSYSLVRWANRVKGFFREYVVRQENEDDLGSAKAIGAISSTSERIYLQAWDNFIVRNTLRILELAQNPIPVSPRTFWHSQKINIADSLGEFESGWKRAAELSKQVSALKIATDQAEKSIEMLKRLAVSIQLDGSKASRSWESLSVAQNEVHQWLKSLEKLYDFEKKHAELKLELQTPTGEAEYNFSDLTVKGLNEKIDTVLELVAKGNPK